MPTNTIEDPDLMLIRNLIELNGLSISKAAEVMNIQRSNLSSWLNGKPNVFSIKKIEGMLDALGMRAMSDPSTGIRLCYLSPDIVHLWQVEIGSHSIIDVLRFTEPEASLQWMEIFQVDAYPKGRFNLMRRKSDSGDLIILVANKDSTSDTYPVTTESLGFGRMAGTIEVPLEKWIGWWKTKTLEVSVLRDELASFTKADKISEPIDNALTTHELDVAVNKLKESQCTNEGLKGIMRTDMTIVESHKPSGVIKSRVVNGTAGKVVGFFIQPTDESAPQYTITIVSKKPLQTQFVDRGWEPSVVEDFKSALGLNGN